MEVGEKLTRRQADCTLFLHGCAFFRFLLHLVEAVLSSPAEGIIILLHGWRAQPSGRKHQRLLTEALASALPGQLGRSGSSCPEEHSSAVAKALLFSALPHALGLHQCRPLSQRKGPKGWGLCGDTCSTQTIWHRGDILFALFNLVTGDQCSAEL